MNLNYAITIAKMDIVIIEDENVTYAKYDENCLIIKIKLVQFAKFGKIVQKFAISIIL